jgi:hypothetical protein
MMAVMNNLLFVVGFLVEALGLTLAAVGLRRTWKANTDGREPLWPWLGKCADFVLYRVLRRRRTPVTITASGSAHGHSSVSGSVYGHTPLNDGMTVDQKIEAVQSNALSALKSAAQAQGAVAKEQREREQALNGLAERLSGTEAELRSYAKRLVVDGIPMAIGGLAVIGLGLLIQTVGNLI